MMKRIAETTLQDVFEGMFFEPISVIKEKGTAVNSALLCRDMSKKQCKASDVFCPMCELYHENNSMCQYGGD